MYLETFRKLLCPFGIGFCLIIFLVACQPEDTPTSVNESSMKTLIPETPDALANETQPGPENSVTLAPSPTMTATPTVTPRPLQPTSSATSTPTITATRTFFGGWLLFSSRRQDSNEDGIIDDSDGVHLYSLDLSTNELTQLTSGNHQDLYPAWSPDRSQVAFASDRDGGFDLYVMNADGSEVKRLTNTPEDETKPRWSPDGTQIVCVQERAVEAGLPEKRLYLISPTRDDMQKLTDGPEDDDPDWSPDGRYLTFTRIEEHSFLGGGYLIGTVHLLDIVKNQVYKLTPDEPNHGIYYDPKWLPRNDYFLSMRQGPGDVTSPDNIEIFELKWDDGQPTLSRLSGVSGAETYVWGPNGEWLVAVVYSYDFVFSPVDLFTQGWTSIWERGEFVSNDTFYVDFPDWAP
jgi:Tol biopolymer transport system component